MEIGIVISGGVITKIYSDQPVNICLLDLDVSEINEDGDVDENIVTVEGDILPFGETVYSQLKNECKNDR